MHVSRFVVLSKNAARVANSVDPDQTLPSAASDQDLHLFRPVRTICKQMTIR